jgi:hypothetical protein
MLIEELKLFNRQSAFSNQKSQISPQSAFSNQHSAIFPPLSIPPLPIRIEDDKPA